MKLTLLCALILFSGRSHALSVYEVLQASTGWPPAGYFGTMKTESGRGDVPGGYWPKHGIGYIRGPVHGHGGGSHDNSGCSPVPLPGGFLLMSSALACISVICRRGR